MGASPAERRTGSPPIILRVQDGILAEHRDVIQDEATEEQSKSKAPMFGDSFPASLS
jgi:predicted SnoaL-like aldol condensation-catalyzing enzyme